MERQRKIQKEREIERQKYKKTKTNKQMDRYKIDMIYRQLESQSTSASVC
jgi:hypothetical protein